MGRPPGVDCMFQSPSRGGHLRGAVTASPAARTLRGFSPLREGDTSVAGRRRGDHGARNCFSPLREGDTSVARGVGSIWRKPSCFSPLREGDTSVALPRFDRLHVFLDRFSPLREGDTSVALPKPSSPKRSEAVSVPFARGTPPWRGPVGRVRAIATGFSPLREGDTSVALPASS